MEVITCSTQISRAAEFHKSIRLVQRYFQVFLCSFGFFLALWKKKEALVFNTPVAVYLAAASSRYPNKTRCLLCKEMYSHEQGGSPVSNKGDTYFRECRGWGQLWDENLFCVSDYDAKTLKEQPREVLEADMFCQFLLSDGHWVDLFPRVQKT